MRILSYGDPSILNGDPSEFALMAGRRRCNNCDDCDDCNDCDDSDDCIMDYGDCDNFSMCGYNTNPSKCNWYDADEDDWS